MIRGERIMTGYAIVLASHELERVQAVSIISSVAAASEIPIDIFVTMDGLRPFLRDTVESKAFDGGPIAEAMLTAEDVEVPLFTDQFEQAKELGDLNIYGCEMAMDMMGVDQDDFVDLFDDVLGVAGFLARAEDKQVIFV